MKDRLTVAFKIVKSIISTLKSVPGGDSVDYTELEGIYNSISVRFLNLEENNEEYEHPLLEKCLDDLRSNVSLEGFNYDDKVRIFDLVEESVSQAITKVEDEDGLEVLNV